MYPSAGQGYLAGLRGALSDAGLDCQVLAEPVGVCAAKDLVADRIQRLLWQQPDVMTGVMGSGVLRHVHSHFLDSQIPFIASDVGADPLMTGGTRNPFIFFLSLGLWKSMYALGWHAARHIGTRACVAAGLHDAGYGITYAFWLGFVDAGGGTVLATEVTHRASADEDPTSSVDRLADHEPDLVLACYSGREGTSFAKAWASRRGARGAALVATPFMTHDFWLPAMPAEAIVGTRTACSWDLSARTPLFERFRAACGVAPGGEPAVFTLLGYEAGLLIAAAVTRHGGRPTSGQSWRDAMSGASFDSPRGSLRVDDVWGEVAAVDHLLQWKQDATGTLETVAIGPLDLPERYVAHYGAIRDGDVRSGWFNPYMIT